MLTFLQSSLHTKKLINLNKFEFPISLVPCGILHIYNHHCKLKSWSIWTYWNFLYLWSRMECYLFTIIITNKNLINLNKLEFHICLSSYGMLLIYNHHRKQKYWLIWTNRNFLYLWSLVECYLFTNIIANKKID